MKERMVVLLVVSMVLGLIFTGCFTVEKNEESMSGLANDESVDLDEPEAEEEAEVTESTDDIPDIEALAERVVNGDYQELGKYKVEEITKESLEPGIYSLTYTSKEKTENIVQYFNELLIGTSNYLLKEIPTIGGAIKGTIDEKSIMVSVQYDKSNDITLVEFYSYD